MENEKLMVNHLIDKGLWRFRAYFLESVGELQGTQSGPERGGIGCVIELIMAKQVYKKIWLVGVLQKF